MKKELTVKELASLGGQARAKKLSKKRRLEISQRANAVKSAKGIKFIVTQYKDEPPVVTRY